MLLLSRLYISKHFNCTFRFPPAVDQVHDAGGDVEEATAHECGTTAWGVHDESIWW